MSGTALDLFLDAVAARPGGACTITPEANWTYADVDRRSDAVAAWLAADGGVRPGDRVALFLQNDAEVVVVLLAAWKIGAIGVPVNPMLREGELGYLLRDCEPSVLVAREELVPIARAAAAAERSPVIVLPSPDLGPLMASGASAPVGPVPTPSDPAFLVYTSGTTGRPKGAVNTHANVVHSAGVYQQQLVMDGDDVVLGGAPLFHITGLVAGIALSHRCACPLVLLHRFEPAACLEAIARWRCTMTVMAITAYIALMADERFERLDLSSLTKAYSGGAPVSPSVVERWRARTGTPIRNVYGLTETTSPTHLVPLGVEGRVHATMGACSVGLPVPGCEARIVDPETGTDVPAGAEGEIQVRGPMVVPGYWRRDDISITDADGWFRTGDIGIVDEDGWYYIVDRLKDMINASGFKVWPREVEDALRQHPAVRDAAVVGAPDDYRGETVKAFVTLTRDGAATPEDLIGFCRERLAAYKRPRIVEILDELPTSAAGKVLRRELRARAEGS
jgi:long-chain acyl-CoA synthetase